MVGKRVDELWWPQSESQVELPPIGDASPAGMIARDALLPSVLDRAFKPLRDASQGEL